ncbi:MAG: DUF1697 domain-containing protein [Candidatus Nanoarchaeia archaeon]
MEYVAFLRGINVAGQRLIRMEVLCKLFTSLKLKKVSSFIQSGNIMFESNEKEEVLLKNIEEKLVKQFGSEVKVFLIELNTLKEMVESNPFKKVKSEESHCFVTFIPKESAKGVILPLFSKNKDVEVFLKKEEMLCSISQRINGKHGFPNPFIEKELKVSATTRNWHTVEQIVALYS